MESSQFLRRVFLGTLLVFLGLTLLGFNLGILPDSLKYYIFNWRALLLLAGLVLVTKRNHGLLGMMFIIAAIVLYLPLIFCCYIDFHAIFWPIALMTAGLFLIVKRKHKCPGNPHNSCFEKSRSSKYEGSDNIIDDVLFFSGSEKVIMSKNFEGGHLVSMFGGLNLNLSKADLAPGTNTFEMVVCFGGCKMIVPPDWNVKINVVSIFGGFVDKRILVQNDPSNGKTLIIKGVAIFGGGELRNA